jgi:hypothetical protein
MRRRRLVILSVGLSLALLGCGKKEPPPPMLIAPNSRLLYSSGTWGNVWSVCDKGHRLYLTHQGQMEVVPYGCLDGVP